MNAHEVLKLVEDQKIQFVDFKFIDFVSTWQHFSVPANQLKESSFEDGFGFDGSSIRGWKVINESDMLVLPDPKTVFVDPFTKVPTLSLTCTIIDPVTREPYSRDPRNVAIKAEEYLRSTGIADTVYLGPEVEFFIFDEVRYSNQAHQCGYIVDSVEGIWNSDREEGPNLGHKPRHKEGYFPVSPTDSLQDIRSDMVLVMQQCGIEVEAHHHEVATAGQCEIDMLFKNLVLSADQVLLYKYIVKNIAKINSKTVTFMPKPLYGDNGSGMHTHISLWKDDKPLFAGNQYAGLSELCLHFIGGILKHASSILAFAAPSTNSYKRLVPGFEAPVNLAYSQRNRSAAIRIPMYSPSPNAKRVEFRPPDPTANPYLSFSALLMAGLDGVQNRIDPGDPLDKDIYDLPPEELAEVESVPGSLEGALQALAADHDFLLKGDVFTQDVIDKWIEYKTTTEVDALRMRPHPYEFYLYYDI